MSEYSPSLNDAYQIWGDYNQKLFHGGLPATKIEFSDRLTSTAGLAYRDQPLIRLSLPLLQKEQYFHDTLVHEMIHVCQRFVAKVEERPHGVYFSAWMHAINEVFQYEKGYIRSPEGKKIPCLGNAKIKVQVSVQHQYLAEQDAHRQNLVGRIKKLLALTDSPYEHEAQAALLKAQQLMQSHQVEDNELAQSEEGSELEMPIIQDFFYQGKRLPAYWNRFLLMVLAKYYKCQYVQCSGVGIGVYGHRPYIEIVRHLYQYYEDVINQTAKQHAGKGTVYLNNFRDGMVDRLQTKLQQKKVEPCLADLAKLNDNPANLRKNTKPHCADNTLPIILQKEAAELRQFIDLINPGFYSREGQAVVVKGNQKARKQGYASGGKLSVSTPMAPSSKKLEPGTKGPAFK